MEFLVVILRNHFAQFSHSKTPTKSTSVIYDIYLVNGYCLSWFLGGDDWWTSDESPSYLLATITVYARTRTLWHACFVKFLRIGKTWWQCVVLAWHSGFSANFQPITNYKVTWSSSLWRSFEKPKSQVKSLEPVEPISNRKGIAASRLLRIQMRICDLRTENLWQLLCLMLEYWSFPNNLHFIQ